MKNNDLINLKKVEKMAYLSIVNGLRLHFDSIILFKNKSYPSSFLLSILALEEFGKFFLIEDFWWSSKINGRMGKEWEEKYIGAIYFHKSKQISFAYHLDVPYSMAKSKFIKELYNGNIENNKQNATYVHLPKNKRELNLKGKINNPINISRKKAINQITNLNDKLKELTLCAIKDSYCFDIDLAYKILNQRLYTKLQKFWTFTKPTTTLKLNRFKKL